MGDNPGNCTECPIGEYRGKDDTFNVMMGVLDDESCIQCTGDGGPNVVWTTTIEGATNISDCVRK